MSTVKNTLSKIPSNYPARAAGIYEYMNKHVSKPGPVPVIHIASPVNTMSTIGDLGVVICNFGDSETRRNANTKALRWTLVSKPKPYFVLVDAQLEGGTYHYEPYIDNERVFGINKTIPEKAKGMFMKEALWNIGAKYLLDKNIGITKLVFMDMDTEFVDQMWALEVSSALNKYDCISPHMASYYAENDGSLPRGLQASIGYNQTLNVKHPGFEGMAFGCTADFYTNRLNSNIRLITSGAGDTYLWYNIAGSSAVHLSSYTFAARHAPDRDNSGMLPRPKIGHGGQILTHRDHGSKATRIYRQRMAVLKRCNYQNFDDYAINEDGMPEWVDNVHGTLMSRILPEITRKAAAGEPYSMAEVMNIYEQEAVDIYGPITHTHPLVVTCVLRSGGTYSGRHVRWLKEQFDRKCQAPFTFICLSDTDIEGIDTVPLELTVDEARGSSVQIEQYKNIWPENASVLTCDLDTVIHRSFIPHRCPENEFFMAREFEHWERGKWCLWNGGLTYFRGNFSFLFDLYKQHIAGSFIQQPRYLHTGAQEFLVMGLRLNGVTPKSIEPHFCCRFWNNKTRVVPPETAILQFPGDPKPWDIHNCSFIPSLPRR